MGGEPCPLLRTGLEATVRAMLIHAVHPAAFHGEYYSTSLNLAYALFDAGRFIAGNTLGHDNDGEIGIRPQSLTLVD